MLVKVNDLIVDTQDSPVTLIFHNKDEALWYAEQLLQRCEEAGNMSPRKPFLYYLGPAVKSADFMVKSLKAWYDYDPNKDEVATIKENIMKSKWPGVLDDREKPPLGDDVKEG